MGQESWTVETRVIGQDQNQNQRGKIEQTGRVMPTRLALDQDGQFSPDHENPKLRIEDPDSKKATTIYVIWDPIGATSTTHTSMITVGPQVSHAMARC